MGDAVTLLANRSAARPVLQIAVLAIDACAVVSLLYLIGQRRKLERMHGEAWANTSQRVVVGVVLVALSGCLLVVISAPALGCGVEALLSTAMMPVSSAVYGVRAWALMMQFARVTEQTRWFHLYQMPTSERDHVKAQRPPFSVLLNSFLTQNRWLGSTAFLLVVAVALGAGTWLPLAWARYADACQNRLPPALAIVIAGSVVVAMAMVWWQFKGRDDSIKQKRELVQVACVLLLVQAMRSAGALLVTVTDYEIVFWYEHALDALQLALMVLFSLLVPFSRVWRFRDQTVSQSEANNQRLVEILASSRYKEEFRQFLEKQFSQENLIFYDLCKSISAKARTSLPFMDPDVIFEIQDSIHAINNDFVSDSAKFQVNLPNAIRSQILNSVRAMRSVEMFTVETQVQNIQICVNALDQAAASIFSLLAADALPRFLQYRNERRRHKQLSTTLRRAIVSYSQQRRQTVFSKEGKSFDKSKEGKIFEAGSKDEKGSEKGDNLGSGGFVPTKTPMG